jgi:hypothetical protein
MFSLCGRRGGYITGLKSVPIRIKRMGIQEHTAVPDKFSAEGSQGKFVVEEDRKGEL